MSDYKIKKVNPVQLPFIDNGMTVVTKENADAFYWDKYLKRQGTKGINE
jgi:ribose transport system substrate-binding protein